MSKMLEMFTDLRRQMIPIAKRCTIQEYYFNKKTKKEEHLIECDFDIENRSNRFCTLSISADPITDKINKEESGLWC